jgi:hypothetical protein
MKYRDNFTFTLQYMKDLVYLQRMKTQDAFFLHTLDSAAGIKNSHNEVMSFTQFTQESGCVFGQRVVILNSYSKFSNEKCM